MWKNAAFFQHCRIQKWFQHASGASWGLDDVNLIAFLLCVVMDITTISDHFVGRNINNQNRHIPDITPVKLPASLFHDTFYPLLDANVNC